MKSVYYHFLVYFICLSNTISAVEQLTPKDNRNIINGSIIYQHGYCDQPYVVQYPDGLWLCVFTTASAHEGQTGQHIVSSISSDCGKTWSKPVNIEPPDGPEASWAMPLLTPSGRVYVFYDYNGDNIRTLNGRKIRADMLGWYCYKYSDDSGKTWSKRYRLPVRTTACDLENDFKGKVNIMWGIGKPIRFGDSVIFGFTKIGKYMLDNGEGWFFRSDNILYEKNPEKIKWQMLPDGQHGLRKEQFGSVQEEHNIVSLGGDNLYCIYRTTMGFPAESYSSDGGHTWTEPQIARYSNGRIIKHPRACPRIWKTSSGNYLLWFHNHGGKNYNDRNPAWLSGGILKDGKIHWSQPEIVLYHDDPEVRMSYPDLVELDGKYFITETQKSIARVHEINPDLIESLWNQGFVDLPCRKGLALSWKPEAGRPASCSMPCLGDLSERHGFSIEFILETDNIKSPRAIMDSTDPSGKGLKLTCDPDMTISITISDGINKSEWKCDRGFLKPGRKHHVIINVDGGPKIISFIIDGILCDGGDERQYGWGRFNPKTGSINSMSKLRINHDLKNYISLLKIYDRPLTTSQALSNYNLSHKDMASD